MSSYWEMQVNTPKFYNWSGYAFESIIYKHIGQVRSALGLDVTALQSSWRYYGKKHQGAQIDLLFNRKDDAITICEIKYTKAPFNIDISYVHNLEQKIRVFKEVTRTKKQIFLSMISANGIKQNMYSKELINGIVTLENLFVNN